MCLNKLQDPAYLLQQLLCCCSITPVDDGAQSLIQEWLDKLGFSTMMLDFDGIKNLYASRADALNRKEPHFLFAGHSDVVPTPQEQEWRHPPFAGIIEDNVIYGRGAQDMKGGIASFIAAIAQLPVEEQYGQISLAITGDEEGTGINGTVRLMRYLAEKGEKWDIAIVGEPTCKEKLGDIIKIGRRGSLNGSLRVKGLSGHVAYPQYAQNAISKVLPYLNKLHDLTLDEGNENFPASNLEITQIASGGGAVNIIPGEALIKFNIRFNDLWNIATLQNHIEDRLDVKNSKDVAIKWLEGASESFLTNNSKLVEILSDSIVSCLAIEPKLDTSGGTSDARFIKNYCDVVEFGLCGSLMHKINESVNLDELKNLTKIYHKFLKNLDKF